MRKLLLFAVVLLGLPAVLLAGPKVEIVVGEKAPPLEKRAAEEVSALLTRLYQAAVTQSATPSSSGPTIFIGSPATNPSLEFAKTDWPKLTDQGHILKSTRHHDQPVLLIGGGSPVATYWAAAEFAHHLGVRTMLYGDLDPITPPAFSLENLDVRLEPQLRVRGWHAFSTEPYGSISWSKAEHARCIRQLAKLKLNHLVIKVHETQPFVHFECRGVAKRTGTLWEENAYPVSGDTAGRAAFAGAKYFINPEFAAATTYEQRIAAGQSLIQHLIDSAHEVGMTVALDFQPGQAPREFDAVKDSSMQGYVELAQAQTRAYLKAYPAIDEVYLSEIRNVLNDMVAEPSLFKVSDQRQVPWNVWTINPAYVEGLLTRRGPEGRVALNYGLPREALEKLSSFAVPKVKSSSCVLDLYLTSNLQMIPNISLTSFTATQAELRKQSWAGSNLTVRGTTGEADLSVYLFARNSFGSNLTPSQACDQLLTPVCGDEVHTRVYRACEIVEGITTAVDIDRGDGAANILPEYAFRNFTVAGPAPELWGKMREAYLNAMNEMYRANTRAREGSRSYTLYLARRYEFGFEYMNCLLAMRAAAVAKNKGDKETHVAELEKAIDSINSACNALAAVARSNSDRGLIAVLNAQVYRPLVKELEKGDAEE